jgi:N-acetylneuraminic acid mutarotase
MKDMTASSGPPRRRRDGRVVAVIGGLLGLVVTMLVTITAVTALPASAATATGAWAATGNMVAAREGATATLLPNGEVLVAGGVNASATFLASAELYNPNTGTWQATGSMSTARSGAAATLLPDGQVLVVAGSNTYGYLASAELYNPATGTWQATGSLATPEAGATATLLPDGDVLVAGGATEASLAGGDFIFTSLANAELYNPATGTWQTTTSMNIPRFGATATLLANGTVLVAGGSDTRSGQTVNNSDAVPQASAEIYTPATQQWQMTGAMAYSHSGATASLLPNGDVLVAGGEIPLDLPMTPASEQVEGQQNTDLYNPTTNTWQAVAPLLAPSGFGVAATLGNGTVLETGGVGQPGDLPVSTEIYDPNSNTWTAGPVGGGGQTATVLANGSVLVTGYGTAEIYNPQSTPLATLSTLSLTFPPQAVGTTSSPQNITVTNTGTAPLTLNAAASVSTSSAFTANFSACGTLVPGGSCTVQVSFTPTTSGTSSAVLYIQDSADFSPQIVVLTGYSGAQPFIAGITPMSGPDVGGTTVTINGFNLSGAVIYFGSTAASGVVCSADTCTATTPGGSGTIAVQANTASGWGGATLSDMFTYPVPSPPARPVVTAISPSSGLTTGGTTVTVTGSNLSGGNVVFTTTAGTTAATNVSCTASSCTATSPAGTGTVEVIVETPGGTSLTSTADQFTYKAPPAPKVTKISPTSGPTSGGTVVTITGSNLSGGTAGFGTAAATVTTCTASSCTATSPAGTGTVDVLVSTPGGTSVATSSDRFTYQAATPPVPAVTGITPSSGPAAGGTVVTVTGSNLSGGSVSFGTAAAAVTCTASSCTATSPAGTGTVNVTVTTTGGTSTINSADQYTYQAAGSSSNLIPDPGFETAGVPADVWGSSLARSQTVVHSGSWSLAQTATSTSGGWDLDSNVAWSAPITSTKTYTATIWVRATAAVQVDLNVDLLTSTGNYIDSTNGPTVTLIANTWTQLTITGIKVTSSEVLAGMEPNFAKATKGTIIYWDDMSLTTP